MKNAFADDLEWSHQQEDQPWWRRVYERAFPGFRGMESCRDDITLQRKGIDRKVKLHGGRTLYVDEKVRRKVWDDIALEFRHEYPDGSVEPGWIAKRLQTDYLAYAFEPSGDCYVMPFQALQRVWRQRWRSLLPVSDRLELDLFRYHEKDASWRRRHNIIVARNPKRGPVKYHSISIGVPIKDLLLYVTEAMHVSF